MKFTYDEVKKYYSDSGCELLEEVYINCDTKMKYKCIHGNIKYKTLYKFKKQKNKCKCVTKPISKIIKHESPRKITYEYVKQYFLVNDCELLEDRYMFKRGKLKFKCKCGNISFTNFEIFERSVSKCCRTCALNIAATKRTGENHVNWKTDRSKIKIQKLCRKYVKKYRRKYNISKEYDIHHIIYIDTFVKFDVLDLNIINDELNLIELPRDYHHKFHSLISKNSKKEFLNYMTYFDKLEG